MKIVYCFDNNKYKEMAEQSAETVLRYNKDAEFYFIEKDKYNELAEFTEKFCGFKHVSKACYLRFLIPKYFKEFGRCLYLDCDTVCAGDLSELYNTDFEGNYLIGCQGIDYSKIQAKQLGIKFYINSGVILFNNDLMNKEDYFKQIKDKWRGAIGKQKPFSADETIINYVFHKKIKLVNEKYNYCYKRPYVGREVNPKDVKIWHVTGADKANLTRCLSMIQP